MTLFGSGPGAHRSLDASSVAGDSVRAGSIYVNSLSSGSALRAPGLVVRSSAGVRISADPSPALALTLLGGYIRCDSAAGAFNVTTDTAVNIIAAMPGAVTGDFFDVVIDELPGGAANAVTLVGGAGVTVVGTATVTNVSGVFRFFMTAAATMDAVRIDGA